MNITDLLIRETFVVVKKHGLEETSHYIYAIVFPIIFILGLIGNLFSSIIFSVTKLNYTSCGIYFLLLAICDSLALIGGLHHCLTIGYHVEVPNAAYCRARNFLLYTSMDMSSWMVVAISVDRYLKVKFPIKARMYATRKLSIIVSCIFTIIFIVKNVHLLTVFIGDFTDDAADNCDPNPDYQSYMFFFKNIWPWIDLTTYALLPFIIVAISNALIIHDQYKRRFKLRKRNLDLSLITLLLVSSISLIVCNLPITILAVIYPYISISYDTNELYDGVAFAFDILRLPSYASLALNFYLYYYTSILFRQQTVLLFRRVFRLKTETNDIELPNRVYTNKNQFQERLDSFDDTDDYQQSPVPSLSGSSFISNFYRQ
jgi:growth hormone secretagogue receptor